APSKRGRRGRRAPPLGLPPPHGRLDTDTSRGGPGQGALARRPLGDLAGSVVTAAAHPASYRRRRTTDPAAWDARRMPMGILVSRRSAAADPGQRGGPPEPPVRPGRRRRRTPATDSRRDTRVSGNSTD